MAQRRRLKSALQQLVSATQAAAAAQHQAELKAQALLRQKQVCA